MSKEITDDKISNKSDYTLNTTKNEMEAAGESSLLNSIVEAVMRGDMNQVVTLALSHRSSDQKVKTVVDQALSSAISTKAKFKEKTEDEALTENGEMLSNNTIKSVEDIILTEPVAKSPNTIKQYNQSSVTSENIIYSQRNQVKSNENKEVPCTYYFSNNSIISSNCSNINSNGNTALYRQSDYSTQNADLENNTDDSLNNTLSHYQITNSALQNVESINTLGMSQQSVQVQLPGIGNFLLHIPSNFKPGEPIALPLNLPLTPVSQSSGVNPISIHMNAGQLMSNQLLSLYNPSSNINITAGKKMRAIAPKPSKPTYRQPLIAPKTSSPNTSINNQDGLNSSTLPAPSGPGRRKGNKSKKSGRKRGAPTKSHKNSSYASSTHSIDSQDACQYNENNTLKQSCNNSLNNRSTYQCNYYVNNDSSDYLNQSHVAITHSFNEINSNTLLDNSDSGEKDLLSLAWEISNAELSNTDDFTTAYNLYDAGNLGTDGFVSSEILDQFLQNIQKDDITELTRCSTTQINIDSRVSYASSFTTLPPCSTVLPSVTTSTYLNNYSNNSSNIEMPQCIEIAEVVNLNTEDMLTELEKEENAFLDKFVAQYSGSHQNELIRCDSQSMIPVTLPTTIECPITSKINDSILKDIDSNCHSNLIIEDSEKEIDLNIKESNELSEIAKQIEISCSSHQESEATLKSKIYTMCESLDCQSKIDNFSKENDHISEANFSNNASNTISFCTIPNTSIELIYSTNDSSLLDEKTQCLMSINFDSKRTNESSFYVTDSTLKSKTLDDFGLFEFCTDGEISLNMKTLNESANTIIDDDNKYIEPPILEDISDATPIQSDNESEDEDIDELAFKFSKLNYFNSGLNKMKKIDLTEKLYFNEFIKTTPSLKKFRKHYLTPNQSKNWYIGNDEIKIVDVFSKVNLGCDEHVLNDNLNCESKPIEDFHNLKESSEEKYLDDSISLGNVDNIICNIKLNKKTENDYNMLLLLESNIEKNDEKTILIGNQTNIICTQMNGDIIKRDEYFEDIFRSLTEENIKDEILEIITDELEIDCNLINKTQKYKARNTVCSTLKRQKKMKKSEKVMHAPKEFKTNEIENMTDIPRDRQRRLRKPPKKLAIYQSINFIENKFSIAIDRKIKSKRKVEFSEKQKLSTDFKRCTRSKGSISKSFDSFYEAISRHKITSTSKSKISQKNISHKEISMNICSNDLSEEKSNDNVTDVNTANNEFISCTDIDQLSDVQFQIGNSNTIINDNIDVRLSNTKIPLFQKSILNQFKSDYKNSNVIRKYNLRKSSISSKRESDHFIDHNSYVKIQRSKNNTIQNVSEINKRDILKSNMKLSQIKRMRKFDKPKFLQYNINNAMIRNNADEYENIDFHLAFFENKAIIFESVKDNFLYPTFNVNICQTANFVENKRYAYNSTSEFNDKKFYPVRKINRKLRIFSGLEANIKDDNIKFASLIDMSLNDFPFRFQCCSQFAKVIKPNNMLINHSMCDQFIPDSYSATIEIQSFNNSDEPISDTDDIESLDAPLVIVEIDEVSDHSNHIKSKGCCENLIESNLIENKDVSNVVYQSNFLEKPIVKKQNEISDIQKTYALRTKCRQNTNFVKKKEKIKRPLFNRLCKKSEIHHDVHLDKDNDNDLINHIKLKTPICSIEKLSHNDIIANLSVSPNLVTIDMLNNEEERDSNLEHSFRKNLKTSAIDVINSINLKVEKNIFKKLKGSILKKIKTKVNVYKIIKKSLWRKSIHKIFNNKLKSKSKIILNCYRNNSDKLNKNVKLLKDSITHLVLQSRDYNENLDNDDNESINVENDSPNDEFNTYLDSNNVETFSRNYGSFSLKIKVQKKDPNLLEQTNIKKHKKNSKKRKKLRHFLSSIIGSDDITYKMNSSEEYEKIAEFNNEIKRKNRKRKYSLNHDTVCSDVYNTNQDLQNYLNQEIPHLTSESRSNDDSKYQKPIKIKLFKSTNEDLSKLEGSSLHSEKIVFSLQKSDNNKSEFGKTANQKILQIIQNMPSKPCRQAANLAKKKIFSTAKEDRRSQNATLTSIWNSKRSNNGINKGTSDILTIYQNDRGKRPRGRPPKLGQSLFTSEKQASSTGTLKLKIKLSKDFKNCNDSHSSNGENSGRTSTNDSSILNSAVAGINGPSDALSLESNNFINGITEQLDQNIEYLEAKEAKVYFDPNQVDIEKIKNSFYSSKKINQESFSIELHQRLYESSVTNIPNNKSDMSNNRNFSQYGDMESVDSSNLYSNILSKENLSNKLSHLSKDNMNISENCYSNLISNREPQNLSQNNQLFQFDNQLSSPERSSSDVWQNSKTNSSDSLTTCRNNSNSWFSEHRNIRDQSFPNSNSIIYNSYMTSPVKESKSCIPQNQNPSFVCENENSDSKLIQRSPSKRSASSEGRKSVSNSFSINESHNQLSPHYIRSGIGSVPSQLNIHPWSDDTNHNTSLNHTAAAWVTYAQQQAAAAAYMDPQMKAYYNLALSQSMLNNPYCGSYGNPAANSENFYSSLHSQYLNNSKESSEKINISNGGVRNHSDPMGTFMEAAQMSSWEHFYSAAAMAGYHNSSQGAMDEYAGRAGNMLQAHHMLANGYSGSMLGRDHFSIENNKPPLAHQNQSGSTSPIKITAAGSTPVSSSQAYSHVQMPYSHFSGTTVGFF